MVTEESISVIDSSAHLLDRRYVHLIVEKPGEIEIVHPGDQGIQGRQTRLKTGAHSMTYTPHFRLGDTSGNYRDCYVD